MTSRAELRDRIDHHTGDNILDECNDNPKEETKLRNPVLLVQPDSPFFNCLLRKDFLRFFAENSDFCAPYLKRTSIGVKHLLN